jgi:hypothetical protein
MLNLACKYDLKALKAASAEKFFLHRSNVLKKLLTDEDVRTMIPDVPLLARELLGLP